VPGAQAYRRAEGTCSSTPARRHRGVPAAAHRIGVLIGDLAIVSSGARTRPKWSPGGLVDISPPRGSRWTSPTPCQTSPGSFSTSRNGYLDSAGSAMTVSSWRPAAGRRRRRSRSSCRQSLSPPRAGHRCGGDGAATTRRPTRWRRVPRSLRTMLAHARRIPHVPICYCKFVGAAGCFALVTIEGDDRGDAGAPTFHVDGRGGADRLANGARDPSRRRAALRRGSLVRGAGRALAVWRIAVHDARRPRRHSRQPPALRPFLADAEQAGATATCLGATTPRSAPVPWIRSSVSARCRGRTGSRQLGSAGSPSRRPPEIPFSSNSASVGRAPWARR